MKKTIPTSIGNTLFYIEEDTYKELDDYLSSIRAHFASTPDSAEIVRDIEDRIREQFVEFTGGTEWKSERIITADHVAKLIAQMGRPEDFGDEPAGAADAGASHAGGASAASGTKRSKRKLYRDADNQVIGGVASGIAAYFDLDPIIVRILFLLSLLIGGAGVIAYVILWAAVPEAKTAAQKLEMQGDPVNLRSMGEKAQEEIKKKVDDLKKSNRFGRFFRDAGKGVAGLIGWIIGLGLKISAIAAMVGLTAGFIILIVNPGVPYVGMPAGEAFGTPLYYLAIALLFFVAFIPFLFINSLGTVLMGRKTVVRGIAASILFGFWIMALVAGLSTAATVADKTRTYISSSPQFAATEKAVSLEAFDKLIVQNAQDIKIVKGDAYGAKVRGREIDIERIVFEQEGADLRIYRNSDWPPCFFCRQLSTEIELTVIDAPDVMTAANATRIEAAMDFTDLTVELQNASMVTLTGKADSLTATLQNASKLDAENLIAKKADLRLQNAAKADFHAVDELIFKAENASKGVQHGPASIDDAETDNASKIEKTE